MPNNQELANIALPEVFVADFQNFTCCSNSPVHRHPFYELIWVSRSDAVFFCDFKKYHIPINTLVFVSAGQIHHWEDDGEQAHLTIIGFTLDQISYYGRITQIISELPFHDEHQPPYYTFSDENSFIFNNLFQTIQERFDEDGRTNRDVLLAYLNLILVELERISLSPVILNNENPNVQLTHDFRRLVEKHYLQYKQVQDYANMLGITLNHLVETVRINSGKTPKQIIQERLALEAKRLLVHSQDTVAEISHQLEFKTPTYFGAWFKNIEGITPIQFRQTVIVP